MYSVLKGCPCGYAGDRRRPCRCTPGRLEQYLGKVSGPLLDRIDLHVEVPALAPQELGGSGVAGESSATVRARVAAARGRQQVRFRGRALHANAQMRHRDLARWCLLTPAAQALLARATTELGLSARAHDKLLKISRTIADLAGVEPIDAHHLAEAVQYRSLDRQRWA